jgi:hypothetical protein
MRTEDYDEGTPPDVNHDTAPATKVNGGGENLPAPADTRLVNPFVYFRQRNSIGGGFVRGDIIKLDHTTGAYIRSRGEEKSVLSTDERQRVIINPDEMIDTWTLYKDGEVVERLVYRARDGKFAPDRNELSYPDQADWPYDPKTRKNRDPWLRTVYQPMRLANGETAAFAATGASAISEVGEIVGTYGEADRHGKYPVVDLESRSFPNRYGGTTHVPVFRLKDWEFWEPNMPATPAPPMAIPTQPPAAQSAPRQLPPKKRSGDLDDSIPF